MFLPDCYLFYVLFIGYLLPVITGKGKCEDSISSKNPFRVTKPDKTIERVTSCKKIVSCYPGLCEQLGLRGGKCCKSCRAIGTPSCLDKASVCNPVYITTETSKFPFQSCDFLIKIPKYSGLCSPDAVGGEGNACCKSCKGTCVDSATWKYSGKACRNCKCKWLSLKQIRKCCKKNEKGVDTKIRCQEACCQRCSSLVVKGNKKIHVNNIKDKEKERNIEFFDQPLK